MSSHSKIERSRERERAGEARTGATPRPFLAAAFGAAALVAMVARALPISAQWRPNELGIVSATVLARHPTQLETLWFVLCAGLGIALVWAAASLFARRAVVGAEVLAVEAAGFAALVAALCFSLGPALGVVSVLLVAQAIWLGRRPRLALEAEAAGPDGGAGGGHRAAVLWGAAFVLLALLRTPSLWSALRWTLAAVPDAQFARQNWLFQVEVGQHLAWADALWNGGLHGRDFFCLYGPLYDWGLVGFWTLFSRSIRAWYLYVGVGDLLGLLFLGFLAAGLVRRRGLVLLLLPLFVFVNLRMGWPLLGLALLTRGLPRASAVWLGASGAVAGTALLYSQEFALAFVCAAVPVLAVRGSARGAAAFAGGLLAVVLPLVAVYAARGALGALLADLAAYPGWVMAGFGNLPFPAASEWLPLAWPPPGDDRAIVFRLGLLAGAAPVALVGLAVPRVALRGRTPVRWLLDAFEDLRHQPRRLAWIATGIFGVLSYRSVLGRTDLFHVQGVVPVVALVLVIAVDRIVECGRGDPVRRAVAAGRIALLAAVAALGGFADHVVPAAVGYTKAALGQVAAVAQGEVPEGRVDVRLQRAIEWIRDHSAPDDPVFFVPNNAAWYYLVDRPNPTRFAVTHQMVTDAHRAEALADLEARPPRFVVWDDAALRIDGVGDELVMGRAMLDWIEAHYVPVERFGRIRVWARRDAPPEPSP
jgi:hypothetical protein